MNQDDVVNQDKKSLKVGVTVGNFYQEAKNKGLRINLTPWSYLVAGPGFEPGTFGLWANLHIKKQHQEPKRSHGSPQFLQIRFCRFFSLLPIDYCLFIYLAHPSEIPLEKVTKEGKMWDSFGMKD